MRRSALCMTLAIILAACTSGSRVERASLAERAQTEMIGFSEGAVLNCMGPPAAQADGVWTYEAAERKRRSTTVGGAVVASDVTFNCIADVAFTEGRVSGIRYSGRTGGLLTKDEQCGRLVRSCLE